MQWTADDTNSFSRIHAGLPKGHELVRDASLVTFVGYSLPEYDEDALRLFRENLREDAAIAVIAGNISQIIFFNIGLIDFLSGLLGGSNEMSVYRGLLYHHFCTMLECDPGLRTLGLGFP
jgi:hypothetical protein